MTCLGSYHTTDGVWECKLVYSLVQPFEALGMTSKIGRK
jgi:hypothetical protein